LKRIPRGEYDIVFPHGNYHPTTARQSTKHIDSRLIVEQTAGTRSGILIHTGELVYHSTGCLLIGDCYETHEMSTDYINHSRPETISKETYLRKLDSLGSQNKIDELNQFYLDKHNNNIEVEEVECNNWSCIKQYQLSEHLDISIDLN